LTDCDRLDFSALSVVKKTGVNHVLENSAHDLTQLPPWTRAGAYPARLDVYSLNWRLKSCSTAIATMVTQRKLIVVGHFPCAH
jgi:hypothetical protein